MKRMLFALAALVAAPIMAGTTSTTTPGPMDFYVGAKKAGSYDVLAQCEQAANQHAESAKKSREYRCIQTSRVAVIYTANQQPVEWVLEWGPWETTMTGPCVSGMQHIEQKMAAKIVVKGTGPEPARERVQTIMRACDSPPPSAIVLPPDQPFSKVITRLPTDDRGIPSSDGVGAFRIPCGPSHWAYDDPIVFPGQPGKSHLHMFFANSSTDAQSTTESLMAAGSTCAGGAANKSAYWIPALIDYANGANPTVLVPNGHLWYYKKGYNEIAASDIHAMPNGLKIIAGGNPMAKGPRPIDEWKWNSHNYFSCQDGDTESPRTEYIPVCTAGQTLNVELGFPNCWDGVNLDSADHRSHMAYSGGGSCPATHPVAIPTLSLNIGFKIPPGKDSSHYRLASDMYDKSLPGGYSMHGDVWFAWDAEVRDAWLNNCVRASKDCHAFLLGDGTWLQ